MQQVPYSHIRNFCIIAHIDHGKSTLADRMLQLTDSIDQRLFRDQMLDDMDLERERGITIKSHPVTMRYRAANGEVYRYNLLDTPGHVDFTYEVSRSMAACEGAILVVDAAQGVSAQTVANVYLAMENGLEIVPVLNKVDLPNSDVAAVTHQIEEMLALSMSDRFHISAKTGAGVPELLEAIVNLIPPPPAENVKTGVKTRALIFDSIYDAYRGVISHVRVQSGSLKAGDRISFMTVGRQTDIKEVGVFTPKPLPVKVLHAGEVGYVVGAIKDPEEIRIGDTITLAAQPAATPLPGFREIKPMVFSGIYPVNTADYEKVKYSLGRLRLNDCSFSYQAESSVALGFGFRCGFLGLLHMEIVQERLRREFDIDILSTYPAVVYRVFLNDGTMLEIDNPVHLPETTRIDHIEEPVVRAHIICDNGQIGDIMKMITDRRGILEKTDSVDTRRLMVTAKLPFDEILVDFYDTLKSVTHGYATMDYEYIGYQQEDLVKMDILLNGEPVDAFSVMIHRSRAAARGRQMCKALKESIPPHMFHIPIQAAINRQIIARETVRALRKDVTAKCYGGDITRKRKLLEKQKEGKKRMKQVGNVNVPQSAFIAILKSSTAG